MGGRGRFFGSSGNSAWSKDTGILQAQRIAAGIVFLFRVLGRNDVKFTGRDVGVILQGRRLFWFLVWIKWVGAGG